ncbi:MAG TPA: endonuclease/exonuclease/phosphatase family protein [Candidatus Micrarchaeia archaeon]|nr:endonuclease/exonuclease/phosphatase family protein [Candidatus Micrarchaeia archaeon]
MGPRLRVCTYNVLLGGAGRWERLADLLRAADADLVALQEVDWPEPCRQVADALGYRMVFGRANMPRHQAVLSRLPIVEQRNHRDPRTFLRNSLEVTVAAPGGASFPRLRIHTVHLPAAFHRRGRGEPERVRELAAVRRHAARAPATPHLLVGDCNAVAPGDPVAASAFFARMSRWRRAGVLEAAGAIGPVPPLVERLARWRAATTRPGPGAAAPDPEAVAAAAAALDDGELPEGLGAGLPRLPWLLHPLLERLPRGSGTDLVLGSLVPRDAVQSVLDAGYRDCRPPAAAGRPPFTCPTYEPAVRIDYVFASPELAPSWRRSVVLGRHDRWSTLARRASDHFPVVATFRLDGAA